MSEASDMPATPNLPPPQTIDDRPTRCRRCDAPLAVERDACGVCGLALRYSYYVKRGVFDATGHIAIDVACRSCGYNLRGLGADGGCPECAIATRVSTSVDWLAFSNPAWISRIAAGCRWLVHSVMGYFAVTALMVLLILNVPAAMAIWAAAILRLILLGTLASGAIGWWLITSPDPSLRNSVSVQRRVEWSRRLLLHTVVLTVVFSVVRLSFFWIAFAGGSLIAYEFLRLSAMVCMCAGLVFLCQYQGDLGRRVPDERLGEFGRRFGGAWIAVAVIFTAERMLQFAVDLMGPRPIGLGRNDLQSVIALFWRVGGCMSFAAIVYAVARMVLLQFRLRAALVEQEVIARNNWVQLGLSEASAVPASRSANP